MLRKLIFVSKMMPYNSVALKWEAHLYVYVSKEKYAETKKQQASIEYSTFKCLSNSSYNVIIEGTVN